MIAGENPNRRRDPTAAPIDGYQQLVAVLIAVGTGVHSSGERVGLHGRKPPARDRRAVPGHIGGRFRAPLGHGMPTITSAADTGQTFLRRDTRSRLNHSRR